MRPLAGVVLLILAQTAWAAGAFEARDWQFRRKISVPPVAGEFAEVTVDGPLHDRAASGFRDVRIVSAGGVLIPHVLLEWPARLVDAIVSTEMLNRSVLPGQFTRLEFDTRTGRPHNRLRLTIDGDTFLRRVTVEGSDDRQTWLVLASAQISRLVGAGVGETTIVYPETTYQYVRLTIHDRGDPPLTVTGGSLVFARTIPAREDVWFAGPVEQVTDAQAKTTTITMDLGHRRVPISRTTLEVRRPEAFAREVAIEVSDDQTAWSSSHRTRLIRRQGAAPGAPLSLTFPEVRGRHLRLTISNADDPPLEVTRVEVYGIRRTVLFPASGGETYWLYVGNAAAPMPQYDLPQLLSLQPSPPEAVAAAVATVEANPAYTPPVVRRAWTEERPWLLWGTLGVSILVLVLVIVRTVRSIGTAG